METLISMTFSQYVKYTVLHVPQHRAMRVSWVLEIYNRQEHIHVLSVLLWTHMSVRLYHAQRSKTAAVVFRLTHAMIILVPFWLSDAFCRR